MQLACLSAIHILTWISFWPSAEYKDMISLLFQLKFSSLSRNRIRRSFSCIATVSIISLSILLLHCPWKAMFSRLILQPHWNSTVSGLALGMFYKICLYERCKQLSLNNSKRQKEWTYHSNWRLRRSSNLVSCVCWIECRASKDITHLWFGSITSRSPLCKGPLTGPTMIYDDVVEGVLHVSVFLKRCEYF